MIIGSWAGSIRVTPSNATMARWPRRWGALLHVQVSTQPTRAGDHGQVGDVARQDAVAVVSDALLHHGVEERRSLQREALR